MQDFTTVRDAKEFLISRIVTEAQREGVPLSEIERKMLYFSETEVTLPDAMDVSDTFDRDYDEAEYEKKIGLLVRNFCADSRKNNRDDFRTWTEAVRILRREDHYLLVLIDAAETSSSSSNASFLKLVAIGFVMACVALAVIYLFLGR